MAKTSKLLPTPLAPGDLSGAQDAFASLQQDLQGTGQARRHHHHHHLGAGNSTNQASQAGSPSDQDAQISQGARDLEALQSALNSGDLAGAQQAFASLQQDLQETSQTGRQQAQQSATDSSSTTQAAATTTATSWNSRISQGLKDFQTLETALNSGNLSGAQQAFAALRQDLQSVGQGRHHHHYHHHRRVGSASSATPTESTATTQTGATTARTYSGAIRPVSSASSTDASGTDVSTLDVQARPVFQPFCRSQG